MYGGDLEINVVEVYISYLSIQSDTGRGEENPQPDTNKIVGIVKSPQDRGQKERFTMENHFMGNVERAIEIAKLPELGKVTADKPVRVAENDGVAYYKASVIMAVDERFPTKAGNVTTTVVVIPVDGAKQFETASGNTVKFDGIAPFIYAGRGASHVFTVVDNAGDVVKRTGGRKSTATEVAELKKQLDAIMRLLASK